jgi:hypothetical protein
MGWINPRQYAEKMITLFSDNRATQVDWFYMIPNHIVQQPLPLIQNAKLFADGMNAIIIEKGIIIPEPDIPMDLYQKDYTNGYYDE